MKEEIVDCRPHTRFYTVGEEYRKPGQKQGTWSYTKVSIYDREANDSKIGEYTRNYSSKGPFHAFCLDGKWYALYCEVYHRIKCMSLPDCKEVAICNSNRPDNPYDTSGFCSIYFYIPFFTQWKMTWDERFQKEYNKPETQLMWDDPDEDGDFKKEDFDFTQSELKWTHSTIAFVAGCYWGNDSSWSIHPLYLDRIDEGVLEFGKHLAEMPRKINKLDLLISPSVANETGEVQCVEVNGEYYSVENNRIKNE